MTFAMVCDNGQFMIDYIHKLHQLLMCFFGDQLKIRKIFSLAAFSVKNAQILIRILP